MPLRIGQLFVLVNKLLKGNFGRELKRFLFYSMKLKMLLLFIAGRLNTNEDNENMLGYDLYSSALADILSEPSLSTPITVGLYAKWGSGKSFLLNKLRGESKFD